MVEFTIDLHSKALGNVMFIKRNLQFMMDYNREKAVARSLPSIYDLYNDFIIMYHRFTVHIFSWAHSILMLTLIKLCVKERGINSKFNNTFL